MTSHSKTDMSTPFGLHPEYVSTIERIVLGQPGVEKAVIFGSRAKGTFHSGSDVDIALYGRLSQTDAGHVQNQLNENTLIPLFFDVVVYDLISNPSLREHIDRVGKPL